MSMYRFVFANCSVYYGYNIVGNYEYYNNVYKVTYNTISNKAKTIFAKTKKEIRKELITDCKRYK